MVLGERRRISNHEVVASSQRQERTKGTVQSPEKEGESGGESTLFICRIAEPFHDTPN